MELLLMAIVGVAVSIATELSKKFSVSVFGMLLFLAVFVGGIYQGFVQFAPETFKAEMSTFVLGALGTASLVYGFLIKPTKK